MGLEKYESKQVQIRRPAAQIYAMASRFDNFTPILKDRVEGWEATEDTCSFKIKGFTASMRIIDRVEPKWVKIVSGESTPMDFTFWFQLHEVDPTDTRMRMVLHVELNMMMRMMIGGKLQEGLDKMAEQIAAGLNGNYGGVSSNNHNNMPDQCDVIDEDYDVNCIMRVLAKYAYSYVSPNPDLLKTRDNMGFSRMFDCYRRINEHCPETMQRADFFAKFANIDYPVAAIRVAGMQLDVKQQIVDCLLYMARYHSGLFMGANNYEELKETLNIIEEIALESKIMTPELMQIIENARKEQLPLMDF